MGFGIISGLSRPAGNITGLDTLVSELAPKRPELLQEVIPHLTCIASLVDLGNCASVRAEHETEPAAKALGISLQVVSVHGPKDLENAFRSMLEPRVDALVIQVSAMFFGSEAGLPTWH